MLRVPVHHGHAWINMICNEAEWQWSPRFKKKIHQERTRLFPHSLSHSFSLSLSKKSRRRRRSHPQSHRVLGYFEHSSFIMGTQLHRFDSISQTLHSSKRITLTSVQIYYTYFFLSFFRFCGAITAWFLPFTMRTVGETSALLLTDLYGSYMRASQRRWNEGISMISNAWTWCKWCVALMFGGCCFFFRDAVWKWASSLTVGVCVISDTLRSSVAGVADRSSVHSICITNSLQSYGRHSGGGKNEARFSKYKHVIFLATCFFFFTRSHTLNPWFKVIYCDR